VPQSLPGIKLLPQQRENIEMVGNRRAERENSGAFLAFIGAYIHRQMFFGVGIISRFSARLDSSLSGFKSS
jgi:hypothetical protein